QTHKKLEHWEAEGRPGDYRDVVITAVKEVGRPSFFALLVIAVSFLPIFALEAQEGRLFKPLAFTKNFSMAIAALLAITLDPAMRLMFTRLKPFGQGVILSREDGEGSGPQDRTGSFAALRRLRMTLRRGFIATALNAVL